MGRSGDVWGFWIGQETLCADGWVERFFIYLFLVVADQEMFGADGLG